jgi:predicted dehydrogenase
MRVGLIGLGEVGRVHFEAYSSIPTIRVAAVADLDARRLAFITDGNIARFTDASQMLATTALDIVCVLTPPATHEALVLACAASGRHVLCEKPLALDVASGDRMIQGCEAAGVRLFYGASYRFLPAIQRARELIANRVLGDIVLLREHHIGGDGPDSRIPLGPHHYPQGGPGGTAMGLVDHGVHLIDIFAWLMGARVKSVFGRGNRSGEPLATEHMLMTFDNGATGSLMYQEGVFPTDLPTEGQFSQGASWALDGYRLGGEWDPHPGCIHVHGERGALRIFHYANTLYLTDRRGTRQIEVEDRPSPRHFAAQIEAVANELQTGASNSTARDGLAALQVLLAAFESNGTKAVALPSTVAVD